MPIYSNMPEGFYPRPSDVNAPLRSPLGIGPRGPRGHGITAEVIDTDPYGYFRVQFKDAETDEVLVTTPNLDVGSRLFVTSERTPLNDTTIGTVHVMPTTDLTPLQVSSDRSAVRAGDIVVFNVGISDEDFLSVNTFGIGVVNRVDKINAQGQFVATDMVHFTVTNVFTATLQNGAIKATMIEDGAVTTQKLANGAVATNKLADDSVTTNKIRNANVTTAKLADKSVISSKLGDVAVTTPKLMDRSVTSDKLADNSVTTNKIPDGAVTLEKLGEGAINVPAPTMANPITWDRTRAYEKLTMVTYSGNTYTSRQDVPVGTDITDTDYWALTGNYNAQVEDLRIKVQDLEDDLSSKSNLNIELFGILYGRDFPGAAQSMCFVGDELFTIGEGAIVEWDMTTGQPIRSAEIPEISHGNGCAVIGTYIYIAPNTSNTILVVDSSTLNVVRTITTIALTNLFTIDNALYGMASKKVLSIDINTGTATEIFQIQYVGAIQDAYYHDGILYVNLSMPNHIIAVDFDRQEILWEKYIPKSDGIYPCNESEGIFFYDNDIIICAGGYHNGGNNVPVEYGTSGIIILFRTSILSNCEHQTKNEKNILRSISVNSNYNYEFLPADANKTPSLELACEIVNNLGSGTLTLSAFNDDNANIRLLNGTYGVIFASGRRIVKNIYIYQSNVTIGAGTSSDNFVAKYSTILASSHALPRNVSFTISNIKGLLGVSSIETITFHRCAFKANINGNLGSLQQAASSTPLQTIFDIRCVGTIDIPKIGLFEYAPTQGRTFTIKTIVNGIYLSCILDKTNIENYASGNTITLTTNSTFYPQIQFDPNQVKIFVSTENDPNVFDLDITSNEFKIEG